MNIFVGLLLALVIWCLIGCFVACIVNTEDNILYERLKSKPQVIVRIMFIVFWPMLVFAFVKRFFIKLFQ
jgi:hypothetical protein